MKKLLTLIAALFLSVSAFAMDAGLFEKMIPRLYKTDTIIVKDGFSTHYHSTRYLLDVSFGIVGNGQISFMGDTITFMLEGSNNVLESITFTQDNKTATVVIKR